MNVMSIFIVNDFMSFTINIARSLEQMIMYIDCTTDKMVEYFDEFEKINVAEKPVWKNIS